MKIISNSIILLMIILSYSCTKQTEKISEKSSKENKTNNFIPNQDPESLNTAIGLQNVFRGIAKRTSSVVSIKVKKKNVDVNSNPVIGSGFMIREDNKEYIITNHHVIKNYKNILVYDNNKKEYRTKVVGFDPITDIAILKIKKNHNIKVLPLGDSNSIEVGDIVIAIGNPFNLGSSFTFGVVSAIGRKSNLIDINAVFKNFIQTDAPINKGNSGGPLLNIKGEVIGINTAIYSTGFKKGSMGIGFAIPSNISKDIIKKLITKGRVARGYIGIRIENMNKDLIKYHKIKKGAFVNSVEPNGPGLKAGIKAGDIIIAVNKQKINNANQLISIISSYPPRTKVILDIIRNKQKIQVSVPLIERKVNPSSSSK